MAFENGLPITITNSVSPAYSRQINEVDMINALLEGTGKMRDEGEVYLPKLTNESQKNYDLRLSKAVLAPFFKRNVKFATGKAFYKPVEIIGVDDGAGKLIELTDKMQSIVDDANKQNENMNKFCNKSFEDTWAKGLGYFYVEAPNYNPEEINTREKLDKANIRPYLLYLPKEDVLDVETDENGKIIYCKLIEYYTEFDTSLKVTVEKTRIRLVTPTEIGIYKNDDIEGSNRNSLSTYKLHGEIITNKLGLVPLVPIYTGKKKADFETASPVIDLAYTNIQYYQDESTHETAISFGEYPLLVMIGANGSDIEVGPHKIVVIKDAGGNLKYVEHSGNALEAGRKNLEELRIKLAYCGLKILSADKMSGTSRNSQTATEAQIESIDNNSDLKVAADNFADALNMALYYIQLYLGEIENGDKSKYKAVLQGIFNLSTKDYQEMGQLMELEAEGKMRLETLFHEFKRRNILSDEFNIKNETDYARENEETPDGEM